MKILLENSRQQYSNIVALRNNGSNNKPYLIGNVITGTITISSPATYGYSIHDFSGRTLIKGTLVQGLNTIYPVLPANSIYIIQYQNSTEFHTEKFTRR